LDTARDRSIRWHHLLEQTSVRERTRIHVTDAVDRLRHVAGDSNDSIAPPRREPASVLWVATH
jgi:hypothetical protein